MSHALASRPMARGPHWNFFLNTSLLLAGARLRLWARAPRPQGATSPSPDVDEENGEAGAGRGLHGLGGPMRSGSASVSTSCPDARQDQQERLRRAQRKNARAPHVKQMLRTL